jgi:hypothetical protein
MVTCIAKHGKPGTSPARGKHSARGVDGVPGKGSWKKRMPPCNRADRDCNIVPPRKRADFRLVVRDERAGRTFLGGNRK